MGDRVVAMIAGPDALEAVLTGIEAEILEKALRASGPGGQHVNKTSTAVELRLDVRNSLILPEDMKSRLAALAGSRLTQDGVLVLLAQEHRSLELNRRAARERLFNLIRQAAVAPKRRRPTRPTAASRVQRLDAKGRRAGLKRSRRRPGAEE